MLAGFRFVRAADTKTRSPGTLSSGNYCPRSWRLESEIRAWVALVLLRRPPWACRRPSPPRVLTGSPL